MKIDKMVAALAFVGFCGLVFVIAASAGCGSEDSAAPVLVTVGTPTDTSDTGDKSEVDADASPETGGADAETPEQEDGGWTLPETCTADTDCVPPDATWDWCSATVECQKHADGTGTCEERKLPCQDPFYVGCQDQHCLVCKDDDVATWQNCNDGSPCTNEFCANGGCQYGNTQGWCLIAVTCFEAGEKSPGGGCAICDPDVSQDHFTPRPNGLECDDGDPCTLDDACVEGECESATPKTCNDGNVCTADSCVSWATNGCVYEAVADSTPCADENLCNGQESCNAGNCVATNPLVCDDGDICNGNETCEATTGCKPGVALVCNDDLPCNGEESCDKAKGCVVGISPAGCCTSNADCDDGNACNGIQACVTQTCKLLAEPLVCNDGNACNGTELCDPVKGCTTTPAPNCDDGNQCTADSCDATSGCASKALDIICDDGNACTVGDVCTAGFCKSGIELDCDDKNPCTVDSCDPTKGCVNINKNAACDDGSKCTVGDICVEGSCNSGKTLDCDDENLCTTDSCDPAKGCVNNYDVVCDDGISCTNDFCSAGSGCKYEPDNTLCEDNNLCTSDSCTATGCINSPLTGNPCDDGDACTSGDACAADGNCKGTGGLDCNDGNPCTTDSCNKENGCTHANNTLACDDGDACTNGDVCKDSGCAGKKFTCDDGVSCTTDSCDVFDGCKYAADNTKCEDGNKCTTNACNPATGCSTKVTFSCDDGNPCTEDSCDPATGACLHFNPCDDGDACTEDVCGAGASCSFKPMACNDGNTCTADVCQDGACKFAPSSGAACNDGNTCTTSDLCVAGTCTGTSADYDADGLLDGEDGSCDHTYDVYKSEQFNPAGWSNQCGVGAKIADGTLVGILFRWDENVQKTAYSFCVLDKDADGVSVLTGAKPGGDCNDESSPIQYECWAGGKPLPTSTGEMQATIPSYLTVVVHPGEECPCFP